MNRRRLRNWVLPLVGVALVASAATSVSGADALAAGSQGTDTSLPATASQETRSGRGKFSNLKITVNQTKNLTSQAVSVDWTGGTPTTSGPGRFAGNYLQIFQCWGDDDGTVPGYPGPPPEQCVQGASGAVYGGLPGGLFSAGHTLDRIMSQQGWGNLDKSAGTYEEATGLLWRPFKAVNGTVIGVHQNADFNPAIEGGQFWYNSYFNIVTTNEIAGGLTRADGTGAELFQVQTGVEQAGLGCGQKSQKLADGTKKVPQCWIVVVPRGTPTEENADTPYSDRPDQYGVVTSPLSTAAWANRIAIPLEFNPVDSPCALGSDERRLVGNQMAYPAITSWQPVLCTGGALPPYGYAPVPDDSARRQLVNPSPGAPGMVVVSRPVPPDNVDPDNPIVYAPISASGLAIGFNFERTPKPDAPDDEQSLSGIRVANINLTPRLVAKLLTQSYRQSVSIYQTPTCVGLPSSCSYDWLLNNPSHLGQDPDFLRFNPEFAQLDVLNGRPFSGLQLPFDTSDAAQQMWEWILADPEAKAWLDGKADEWGMKVNIVYSTNPAINPNGAFGDPVPNEFPKSDPFCYQAPKMGNPPFLPAKLCGTDWIPYVSSLSQAAQVTRSAADRPKILADPFGKQGAEWTRELPQIIGRKAIVALTDTVSAAQYGLQIAKLSRAGDDGRSREFIAPDATGLAAGLASMVPSAEPSVLIPSPSTQAAGAYPLTTLAYAAIAPLSQDTTARSEYAALVDYAAGAGQVSGLALGELPGGYLPLSDSLKAQAATAAATIRTLTAPAPTTSAAPTTAAPVTSSSSSSSSSSSGQSSSSGVRRPSSVTRQPATATTVPTEAASTEAAPTSDAPQAVVVVGDEPKATSSGSSVATAALAVGRSRYALPAVGVAALLSALGVLEISKRPRRRSAVTPELPDGEV